MCVDRFGINFVLARNSCFDVPSHKAFLNEDQVNLLPYILLPICGPEEFPEDVGPFHILRIISRIKVDI